MEKFETLTDENFLFFAATRYYNPRGITEEEFYEDIDRFKYIKRIISRYQQSGRITERLLLNHIIIIFNSFGGDAIRMFDYKFSEDAWKVLKPCLVRLNYLDDNEYPHIESDPVMEEKMRHI